LEDGKDDGRWIGRLVVAIATDALLSLVMELLVLSLVDSIRI